MLLFDIEHIIHLLKNYIKMENYFFLVIALVLIVAFFLVRHFRSPAPSPSTCTIGELDFETPTFTLGQTFTSPGSIYSVNRITAVLDAHTQVSGATSFNQSEITKPPYPFGTNQVMRMNNTALSFDFGGVKEVQFEYLDLGGTINLGAKGSGSMYIGNMSSMPAVQIINGVTIKKINVTDVLNAGGTKSGEKGTITLSHSTNISDMLIGGQELFLDNFCFN